MRRVLLFLLALTLVAGLGFIAAIVLDLGNGIYLHEIAGLILVVLLVLALWAAYRLRATDRRPMLRVAIALIALVAAGATGASLAVGAASGALAGLPLLPLVVMLVAAADGIRVTRNLRIATSPTQEKPVRLDRS